MVQLQRPMDSQNPTFWICSGIPAMTLELEVGVLSGSRSSEVSEADVDAAPVSLLQVKTSAATGRTATKEEVGVLALATTLPPLLLNPRLTMIRMREGKREKPFGRGL